MIQGMCYPVIKIRNRRQRVLVLLVKSWQDTHQIEDRHSLILSSLITKRKNFMNIVMIWMRTLSPTLTCFLTFFAFPVVFLFLGRHEQVSIHPRQGTNGRWKEWLLMFIWVKQWVLSVLMGIWVRNYFQENRWPIASTITEVLLIVDGHVPEVALM